MKGERQREEEKEKRKESIPHLPLLSQCQSLRSLNPCQSPLPLPLPLFLPTHTHFFQILLSNPPSLSPSLSFSPSPSLSPCLPWPCSLCLVCFSLFLISSQRKVCLKGVERIFVRRIFSFFRRLTQRKIALSLVSFASYFLSRISEW